MIGGSIFHSTIGNLLDYFWLGHTSNNIRVYDVTTFNHALIIIPIAAVIGSLIFIVIRLNKKLYYNDLATENKE